MTDDESGSSGFPLLGETMPGRWLRKLLKYTDASARIDEKVRLIGALYVTTNGSAEGLEIALQWSASWADNPGPENIKRLWEKWQETPPAETFETLAEHLAKRGFNWEELIPASEAEDSKAEEPAVEPGRPKSGKPPPTLLLRYSLVDELPKLKSDAVVQDPLFSGLALKGQANVWYAEPNTGKTAMAFWFIRRDIQNGRMDPSGVFYFDLDDTLHGLIEKTKIAKANGFHIIAEGYKGFKADDLPRLIQELIDEAQCRGVVIFLDTLKKFTDIMDKGKSSSFGNLVRRFVLSGGTCFALAHTNKRRNADGEPTYAGTSDIIEDFDCAYLVYETNVDRDSQEKTVLFKNKKSRGNVRKEASFQYSVRDGLSYIELLDSINEVSKTASLERQQKNQRSADRQYIEIVCDGIRAGIDTKMAMVANLVQCSECRKRQAIRLIERYEGNEPGNHFWNFRVGPRGAKVYYLIVP